MTYQAPVDDIMRTLKSAAGLDGLIAEGVLEVDEDTIRAVIAEAGKLAAEVLEPLDTLGDRAGSKLVDGKVVTPPGWKQAYAQYVAGGWNGLAAPAKWGGQELPQVVATAAAEIWDSANLAFGLCPLLTHGAIDALEAQGSEELKRAYLPKMVTGEWTGTMNLTEPHAGSDLGQLKTRAERRPDGSYRIFGTKIFITYGDHEMTDNIVHLVLARLPDAPPGTRGISLFLVPKYLVNPDGSLAARNDVTCAGVEHKLGIHASPTCVMKYGENDGAVGYLVGEENRGLNVMFIMMNAARLAVGVQGVALAERATQRAIRYARERKQGRSATTKRADMAPIIEHPDIRRSLLTMKALTQAARAICLVTACETDIARRAKDPAVRATAADRVALLTPVAKAFSTDIGCEVASIGVQVHGGTGYIEETGAAQIYRDARILPIYEGTNGIQALDLITRKLALEGGKVVAAYLGELQRTVEDVRVCNRPEFGRMGKRLAEAVAALGEASRWMGSQLQSNPEAAMAGATPYLRLFGLASGGIYLARGALVAARDGAQAQPIALARFFAENLATAAPGLKDTVVDGADSTLMLAPEVLSP
ncbi:MAG: acyl-CoA dehydrogenase C-terminal domain-containing protein [Hyphomicrobiaceae bacterium]|nr:acyl-CoA dehydrogenase C-terminal domain-containing protein [Hyphomicrobiaceae bacterium]